MEIDLTDEAKKYLLKHKRSGNKGIMKKVELLLFAISENPFAGIGQVEQLKHELIGKWSRRINNEHRIVYSINEDRQLITIHSMFGHYEK